LKTYSSNGGGGGADKHNFNAHARNCKQIMKLLLSLALGNFCCLRDKSNKYGRQFDNQSLAVFKITISNKFKNTFY
jgi:hypothetical protein